MFNEKDQASRTPWRSLVSHLVSAGVSKTRVNKILARDFRAGSLDVLNGIVGSIGLTTKKFKLYGATV